MCILKDSKFLVVPHQEPIFLGRHHINTIITSKTPGSAETKRARLTRSRTKKKHLTYTWKIRSNARSQIGPQNTQKKIHASYYIAPFKKIYNKIKCLHVTLPVTNDFLSRLARRMSIFVKIKMATPLISKLRRIKGEIANNRACLKQRWK